MGTVSSAYPKDDFDNLPKDGPIGVHRKPKSRWQPVLPFLLVVLLVPLLAWGVATLIQRNVPDDAPVEPVAQSEAQPQSEEAPAQEAIVVPESDLPTAAPDDPNDGGAAESPETTPPADAAEVNFQAVIAVLNGTGVPGYAATTVQTLVNAGFVNSWAGNAENWSVDQNTVFYPSADLKPTADAVAQSLGIANVVEDAGTVGEANLVVLLLQ